MDEMLSNWILKYFLKAQMDEKLHQPPNYG